MNKLLVNLTDTVSPDGRTIRIACSPLDFLLEMLSSWLDVQIVGTDRYALDVEHERQQINDFISWWRSMR